MEALDVFNIWRSDLDGTDRFLYKERRDNIERLVEDMFSAGIPIDDVRFLKNRVIVSLITKEGMKNSGKYKGWKDNVVSDFESVVSSVYLTNTIEAIRDLNKINYKHYISMNNEIISWLYDKYGYVTSGMLTDAHTPGSFINSVFVKEKLK